MRAALTALLTTALLAVAAPPSSADVQIPPLGITAPVVPVGIGEGGSLALGHNLHATYIWNRGVRPCSLGSFVLAAHSYEVPGGRALGNRLGQLERGDRIRFPGCSYRVTTSKVVRPARASAGCWDFDGKARGCVITCVGRIGPGNYTHRRVIRIVRVRS